LNHRKVNAVWAWVVVFMLGCYHGINPGMGWLFAVALGLQEKSRGAVLLSIAPIALGHAASIALIVMLAQFAALSLSHHSFKAAAAILLVGFGVYRLVRARHPRWIGMRVGFSGLTLWAFLMATGHGAGLMLLPVLLPDRTMGSAGLREMHHMVIAAPSHAPWILTVGVHTLGYLVVTALVALLVYERFGLRLLRTGWLNLDLVWAIALTVTGFIVLAV